MSDETAPVATDTPAASPVVAADAPPAVDAVAADASLPAAPDELTMLNALKQVVDPELFVNIVDLGLVYGIQEDDHKVLVDMTLTSPACPAGPQIISQAKAALEAIPGVKEATIKLVMSPPWSPDRMTDEARDQLGIF
jgi:metal-sulfur cluster biosynthetic enzyme